ncbi:MAG: Nif3-like dinuclear metal center hexameric protein [Solitalea-like symbiont of Acarus siro]
MELKKIIEIIENSVPVQLAESYDNCGLVVGDINGKISKVLIALECTEEVIQEAISEQAELIITHHPLIFTPIKSLAETNSTNRMLVKLIEHNIAQYSIHTNLDNMLSGVNKVNADKIGLVKRDILLPKKNTVRKLVTFVPPGCLDNVKSALFRAGAGRFNNYEQCSFVSTGTGSFRPLESAKTFLGKPGELSSLNEDKLEVVYPYYIEPKIIKALLEAHPYEEVAFDIIKLNSENPSLGSGIVGELSQEMDTKEFMDYLKQKFKCKCVKHTQLVKNTIKKIAFCGGSGSFLIDEAIRAKADVFITSDIKYHDFFKADSKIILIDIGHYESEQYVPELINNILSAKIPKLEFFISNKITNPVFYY